jgi:hypothetical protein
VNAAAWTLVAIWVLEWLLVIAVVVLMFRRK